MKQIFLLPAFIFACMIAVAQNIGIGTTTPRYPLSFPPVLGQKITLWDDGNLNGNNYGFGVQSGALQMHTYNATDNIVFGFGRSSSLTERMRIINNGENGLSINGRVVLKNGTVPLDPAYGTGLWMYKANNSDMLGFIGVQNNQNMGFYGGPAGWGFTYDAINSRVGINNNNPVNRLSVSGNADITGNVGIGTSSPVNRLDVAGLNNWDLTNTEGDMRVGNSNYRLKIGVALSGGGAGASGIMQTGGAGTLNIGANNKNLIQVNGAGNYIDLTNVNGGIRINGNAGAAGQVLQSNGNGAAPQWSNKPFFMWLTQQGDDFSYTELIGTGVHSVPIPGMDNQSIFIAQPSRVMATVIATLVPYSLWNISSGGILIEIRESSTNTLKLKLIASGYANGYDGVDLCKIDLIDLNAGFHHVRAYHIRGHHTLSGDSKLFQKKLILQIFPN